MRLSHRLKSNGIPPSFIHSFIHSSLQFNFCLLSFRFSFFLICNLYDLWPIWNLWPIQKHCALLRTEMDPVRNVIDALTHTHVTSTFHCIQIVFRMHATVPASIQFTSFKYTSIDSNVFFCYLWNGLVESHNDKTHTHTNGVVKRTTYQPMTDICAPFHFTTAVIRISCRPQAFVIDSMMTNARNGHRPCEIMDWTSYSSLSGFQLVSSTPAFPSLWPNCPRTKSINYGWYLDRIVVECLWQALQASHPFCVTLNCHLKTFADTLHSVTDLYGHAFTSKFHVPQTKFSITLESYRSMWNVSHRQCSNNSILKCNSFLAEFTGERWPGSLHCRLIAVRFH